MYPVETHFNFNVIVNVLKPPKILIEYRVAVPRVAQPPYIFRGLRHPIF